MPIFGRPQWHETSPSNPTHVDRTLLHIQLVHQVGTWEHALPHSHVLSMPFRCGRTRKMSSSFRAYPVVQTKRHSGRLLRFNLTVMNRFQTRFARGFVVPFACPTRRSTVPAHKATRLQHFFGSSQIQDHSTSRNPYPFVRYLAMIAPMAIIASSVTEEREEGEHSKQRHHWVLQQ